MWLVLDTSNVVAVVGVVNVVNIVNVHGVDLEKCVLADITLAETKKHAESLVDAVDRAVAAAGVRLGDVVGVGVGVGPGSFIGVRTGIATAKGLCIGRGIPLVGLPSLVALAASCAVPVGRGLAVVDAKRGEVYAQLVENTGAAVVALEPARAMKPDDATALGATLAFVAGAAPGEHTRVAGLAAALAQRLSAGVVDELRDLAPDYCRGADAKLPAVDPGRHLT